MLNFKMFSKLNLLNSFLLICIPQTTYGLGRVIGGDEAETYYGKFHVSLQNEAGEHVCGGAVITNQYVLTAAHCVSKVLKPDYVKIVVGTTNLDKGGRKYDTESLIIHEDFNYELKTNDIAILKSKDKFDPSFAQSLKLGENVLETGESVCLTGFGAKQPNGVSSRILYAIDLPVFDQETCKYAMRYTRNVTDTMFCTFTKIGQGTCHGDSGGPLIKNNEVVGLVSWGIPCAVGYPDVHTRISPHVEWIRNKIHL